MALHTEEKKFYDALFHVYFMASEDLLDRGERPVTFVQRTHPEVAELFTERYTRAVRSLLEEGGLFKSLGDQGILCRMYEEYL